MHHVTQHSPFSLVGCNDCSQPTTMLFVMSALRGFQSRIIDSKFIFQVWWNDAREVTWRLPFEHNCLNYATYVQSTACPRHIIKMSPIIIVTKNVQLNTNIQSTPRESVTNVSQQGASVGAQSSCWAEWLSPSAECCPLLHLCHFHPIIIWSLPRLLLQRWTNDLVFEYIQIS